MSGSAKTAFVPAVKNILFATDFSLSSQAAIPFVHAFAVHFGSTVHLVHVLPPEARTAVPLESLPELDVDRSDAESAIQAMQASAPFADIAHTATVERGEVWEVLSSILEEKCIDLIVLGTHGRRGLKKLVLGSTAEQIVRLAPCPVLTVGPHITRPHMERPGAPILFATDFSSGSEHALPYAVSLARASRSQLILLHAVPTSIAVMPASMDTAVVNMEVSAEILSDALSRARQQMAELISSEIMQELRPETIIDCAPADEMILRTAENKQAGLIVMGAHRASLNPALHSVAAHLSWATTVSAVLCKATCPVLTVRS